MHALVIESHDLIGWLIEEELRDIGFSSVELVSTQEDAVAAAERHCPDLVTAEVVADDHAGLSAVRKICSEKAVPLIFITCDVESARRFAPDAVFLDKPFSAFDLACAVDRAVPIRIA